MSSSARGLTTHIDHLVITAPTLDDGADSIHRALGVELQGGGKHLRMGTHNRLLKLGDAVYLEVIAVDPDAPPPDRPRWFQLDDAATQQPEAARLTTWVMRTNNIEAAADAFPASPGAIEPMTRGDLKWKITIPNDGKLVWNGVLPSLIQWDAEPHPARNMVDVGCRLLEVRLYHPDSRRVEIMLQQLGFSGTLQAHQLQTGRSPRLEAVIQTPGGVKVLT